MRTVQTEEIRGHGKRGDERSTRRSNEGTQGEGIKSSPKKMRKPQGGER